MRTATTKLACRSVGGVDPGGPAHRGRELAHDREPEPGADARPGRVATVEPVEHPIAESAGMPGPSSATVTVDGRRCASAASPRLDRGVGVLQRVLHEVGDDLGEPVGVGVGGERGRAARPCSVMPSSSAAGRNASTALRTTSRGVDRRGRERELVGVEAGEVEQVAHEPFEPAGLGHDHARRAAARFADPRRRSCRRSSPPRSRGSTSAACAGRGRRSGGTRAPSRRGRSSCAAIALSVRASSASSSSVPVASSTRARGRRRASTRAVSLDRRRADGSAGGPGTATARRTRAARPTPASRNAGTRATGRSVCRSAR